MNVIEILGEIMSGRIEVAPVELTVDSPDIVLMSKVASGEYLCKEQDIDPSGDGFIEIIVNDTFCLAYDRKVVEINAAELKKNLFWWNNDFPANSRQLNVKMGLRQDGITVPLEELKTDIHLVFKAEAIESEEVTNLAQLPKSSATTEEKDKSVLVYKLDPPKYGSGLLTLQLKDISAELMVTLLINEIPSFKEVQRGKRVNSSSPRVSLVYSKETEEDLLYLGILPFSKQNEGGKVKFSFEILDAVCRVWKFDEWNTGECKIGSSSDRDKVHCFCRHLSLFGASFFVPPNYVNPFTDIHLFRNLLDNPYILFVILALLLVFFALFIFAYRRDKRDRISNGVHLLPDNFPNDKYGYVLVVFTGHRFDSGTTSKVGIMLAGHSDNSRKHILNYNKDLLQGGQENWFLIFTPRHLGYINSIAIWHNNAGPHPDWYCKKIMVYDLTKDKQYLFVVDGWLSVSPLLGGRTDMVLENEGSPPRPNVYTLTKANVVSRFKDAHSYLSIFLRHPRSPMSRCEKLTIRFVVIVASILTTLMFYGAAKGHSEWPWWPEHLTP